MNYSVEISRQADADLRDIFEHIAMELHSLQSAEKLLALLENKICSLDQMPERYHRYQHEPWLSRGMRVMVVGKYCVFYIPNSEQKTVSIIRVLYSGRDIETVLAKKGSSVQPRPSGMAQSCSSARITGV
ncbi:MAG: type II toxin-antitoxin system RelE/ParE family toxin [Subdoligranulum sp.]|nr:type II toxin-antitoxin system RelE/ParE family toxin [Subdoligranulum sp.]